MAAPRPRRSVLFMPGGNARAMEKARDLAADGLIFDLEDSVAPNGKEAARVQIAAALARGGYGGRERLLRVNGAGTPWHDADFRFAAMLPLDGVVLPKVGDAREVRDSETALAASGAPAGLALWCMMETPRAFLHAEAIAAASDRLAGLIIGTEDLAKDLGARARPDRLPFIAALSIALLAARAAGLCALDAVYPDFNDDDGFAAQCRQGRDLGFDGKTLIHPRQIAAANAAFAPEAREIEEARHVIAAFDAAETAGRGVAMLDGKMIERLHADAARRLLALAAEIAERDAR
ncbi:MAG: HpcH/HpaI aldolase/citrate lyase family protein [Stellaceae bacterium]